MHQLPSLPLASFHVSIDWSPILRANWSWESKMSAFSFQSNYQIRLNLIIFQTLGGDLYIIRAICLSRTASFLTQSLWKKVSSLLDSLYPSPVHWVIKIVISFAESLSCHLSRLFSSSSHVSIAAPILLFILWPRPAWMGWILSVWFSGSM